MSEFLQREGDANYLEGLEPRLAAAKSFAEKISFLERELLAGNLGPGQTEAVEQKKRELWANAKDQELKDWMLANSEAGDVGGDEVGLLNQMAAQMRNDARTALGLPENHDFAESVGRDHLQELESATPKEAWKDLKYYLRHRQKSNDPK
jgi:hypothetical protein